MNLPYICGGCEKDCKGTDVDFGIGPSEFWGSVSNDVHIQFVSACCDHEMFYDPQLSDPVSLKH